MLLLQTVQGPICSLADRRLSGYKKGPFSRELLFLQFPTIINTGQLDQEEKSHVYLNSVRARCFLLQRGWAEPARLGPLEFWWIHWGEDADMSPSLWGESVGAATVSVSPEGSGPASEHALLKCLIYEWMSEQ